ncbi:hypothetical protein OQI89_11365 [Lentilactobacillus diolivorans]|uniref:phage neck terminator protein n=1 Tax=Lentilactobacillus TaxID=2767893 RepID=UPI00201BFD90|nr:MULTISPECIES: hypothetical protein [Lentilactobacillus]MDH5106451.1 hypothetical protein [Lentilactobacillus diolivorans]
MKRTINWQEILAIMIQEIRSLTNLDEKHVVEDYSIGNKPSLPFITVHPRGSIVMPVQHMYPMHEPVDTHLSIVIHTANESRGLDLMDNLQANLRDPEVHYQVKQKGIIIVDVEDPQDNSFIGINNSIQQYGFDLVIRVERNFESDQPTIEAIDSNNEKITRN